MGATIIPKPQHFAVLVTLILWFAGCALPDAESAKAQGQLMEKVGPELIALYGEYSNYVASGKHGLFKPRNSLIQIVDDRVVVDAVASGDAETLKADLEALGMKQAVAFGRIVSGQLPILDIPSAAELPALNSVRAATAVIQKRPSPFLPRILTL